jgi:gamma-glutamyl-gamma-aminobutyrate hydrolase PuuD
VNSYHNQGIRETGLGSGFSIAAIDMDGYVEAMEHKNYPITGIMWHPECQDGNMRDIFLFKRIEGL